MYLNLGDLGVSQKNTGNSILLLEDEDMVGMIVCKMLEHIGYEVDIARDGERAVELYHERYQTGKPFSAVIMDLSIPNGMGGQEAVTEVLKIDPGAKVVVSSGYTLDPAMVEYQKFGFSAAIGKPYNIPALDQLLNELVQ